MTPPSLAPDRSREGVGSIAPPSTAPPTESFSDAWLSHAREGDGALALFEVPAAFLGQGLSRALEHAFEPSGDGSPGAAASTGPDATVTTPISEDTPPDPDATTTTPLSEDTRPDPDATTTTPLSEDTRPDPGATATTPRAGETSRAAGMADTVVTPTAPATRAPRPGGHIELDVPTNHVSIRDLTTPFGMIERLDGTVPLDRLVMLEHPSPTDGLRVLDQSPVHVDDLTLRISEKTITKSLQREHPEDPEAPVLKLTTGNTFSMDGAKNIWGVRVPYHVEGQERVTHDGHLLVQIDSAVAWGYLPITPVVHSTLEKAVQAGVPGRKVPEGLELAPEDLLPPFLPLRLREVENRDGDMRLVASSPTPEESASSAAGGVPRSHAATPVASVGWDEGHDGADWG